MSERIVTWIYNYVQLCFLQWFKIYNPWQKRQKKKKGERKRKTHTKGPKNNTSENSKDHYSYNPRIIPSTVIVACCVLRSSHSTGTIYYLRTQTEWLLGKIGFYPLCIAVCSPKWQLLFRSRSDLLCRQIRKSRLLIFDFEDQKTSLCSEVWSVNVPWAIAFIYQITFHIDDMICDMVRFWLS